MTEGFAAVGVLNGLLMLLLFTDGKKNHDEGGGEGGRRHLVRSIVLLAMNFNSQNQKRNNTPYEGVDL